MMFLSSYFEIVYCHYQLTENIYKKREMIQDNCIMFEIAGNEELQLRQRAHSWNVCHLGKDKVVMCIFIVLSVHVYLIVDTLK